MTHISSVQYVPILPCGKPILSSSQSLYFFLEIQEGPTSHLPNNHLESSYYFGKLDQ